MGICVDGSIEIRFPSNMHILDLSEYKRCYSCHTSWHISQFGKNTNLCKECASLRSRLHYALYPPAYRRHKIARRNAHARGALGTFTVEEWRLKIEEYHNQCAYCGQDMEDGATVDNIAPACRGCNIRKNSKTSDEFKALIDTV